MPTTASGTTALTSYSPRICRNNNGTSLCSLGYMLNFPGLCFSQSLGKINSTGFLPSFPICLLDYESILDSTTTTHSVFSTTSGVVSILKPPNYGTIEGLSFPIQKTSGSISASSTQLALSVVKEGSINILASPSFLQGGGTVSEVVSSVVSTTPVFHSGKNIVAHIRNRLSQYWVVDTYSDAKVLKYWPYKEASGAVLNVAKIQGSSYINSTNTTSSGINNPYAAMTGDFSLPLGFTLVSGESAENPKSLCVDDLTAPVVSGTQPVTGSLLNLTTGNISFNVLDAVGGVDVGVLEVTVSGSVTVQPEGFLVVSSGTDQTGGLVSVTGDPVQYTVTYAPSLSWQSNERVTVTVSGQDLEPQLSGVDWSCYDTEIRNIFGVSYSFKIATENDFGVLITAVPDTAGPIVVNEVPERESVDATADTVVSMDIVDVVSGVTLSSLNVYVDSINIVSSGTAAVSGVIVSVISGGYKVTYTDANFTYGDIIPVRVEAADDSPAVNGSVIIYSFSVVSGTSLTIENFSFADDTSYLAETKDLSVDVYDNSFGISDTYFSINGATQSGTRTPITGTVSMTTTVPGLTTLSGVTVSGSMSNVTVTGATLVGSTIYNGAVVSGTVDSGAIASNFPAPYYNWPATLVVSSKMSGGSMPWGILADALVSGTNWNGSYSNTTVSGVGFTAASGSLNLYDTTVTGTTGYSLVYHPVNNYNTQGTIRTNIYAINNNSSSPVVKNPLYYLYHGFRVINSTYEIERGKPDVDIAARAINSGTFQSKLSQIYRVSVYEQPAFDLSASITGIVPWRDLSGTMTIHSPTHSYGELIDVEVYIEDKDGNSFGPFTFTYTVEDRP